MKQTRILNIQGMTCDNCIRHVTEALKTVPGLQLNSVGLGNAEVTYDPSEVDERKITSAVLQAGYDSHFPA